MPDWSRLGFEFVAPDAMFVCRGRGGAEPAFDAGSWMPFGPLAVTPASPALNYALSVFEGLKAERGPDGRLNLFRPEYNAARFRRSAERLALAPFPAERFLETVAELVRRNERLVPPHGVGTWYVRPLEFADDERIGLATPERFVVAFLGTPVGSYFRRDVSAGVRLRVLEQARVAPGGTGDAKTGANYAAGIARARDAKQAGFDDVLYLDAREEEWVTETSGSNVFGVQRGTLVTPPLDDQVLAGCTRDSVIRLARERLGLEVEERPVAIGELVSDCDEVFCTGTAWTVQRVAEIEFAGEIHRFAADDVRSRVHALLRGVQDGTGEDPFGWRLAV